MVDYLVVGAGSAGCVVAARLADVGSVMLLEAGPAEPPPGVTGVDFMAALAEPGWTWPDLTANRHPTQQPRGYLRGRGLGGSSAVNALVAIDGLPDDYDRWNLAGWAWPDLAGSRQRAVVPTELSIPGAVGRALVHAAQQHGMRRVQDACAELGVGPLRLNVTAGRRMSAAETYLSTRTDIDVRTGCLVDRVLFEGTTSVGVRLNDGTELEARTVILAAGAIHSPAVLLRSGIDRPGVGTNLQDHAALSALLMLRADHHAPSGAPSATALARFSSGRSPADLQLVAFDHLGPLQRNHGLMMVGLMDVHSRGRVTLVSDDPTVDPIIDGRMLTDLDGHDQAALLYGLGALIDVVTSDAVSAISEQVYLDDVGTTPDTFDRASAAEFCTANLSDYVHPVGTCAMGLPDDPNAVVDPDGKVIGVSGLRIADASVIPRLPRANTHVPVTIVAEELARRWRAETGS